MLSAIKNASVVGKSSLEIPFFRQAKDILTVLKSGGFIKDVGTFKFEGQNFKGLRVDLVEDKSLVRRLVLQRVSRPGRRIYIEAGKLPSVKSGLGVLIVSTSRGVMSGDEAKKKKLGGEVICKVHFD